MTLQCSLDTSWKVKESAPWVKIVFDYSNNTEKKMINQYEKNFNLLFLFCITFNMYYSQFSFSF